MSEFQWWDVSAPDQPSDGPVYDTYVLAPKDWSAHQVREALAAREDTESAANAVRLFAVLEPADHLIVDGALYVKVQGQADILGEPSRIPGVQRIIAATEALGLYDRENDEK
ncbi:hypothetical protein [Sulfobacillus harzensis]|uniref:Uncharacterized protein n=1 Tax=Sulfobacillus harzensis TaxID=2729629 RepID=A0A7Y0Q5A9_9FIRM|nr:hypothetical protein [Sulfobacillus harzensis]NMP24901.1 hypothetical protein [Sulfobacillus harzensis]